MAGSDASAASAAAANGFGRARPGAAPVVLGRAQRLAPARGSWTFSILLLAICFMSGAGLKTLGPPFLAVIILISIFYAGRDIYSYQNIPAILLSLWGLLYIGLSYLNVLPDAWTRLHDPQIILQQASFVFLLLPVIAASQKWWEDNGMEKYRVTLLMCMIIFVGIVSMPVGLFVLGDVEAPWDFSKLFVTFQNDIMIAFLAIVYLAFVKMRKISGIVFVTIIFILSVTIEFRFQNALAYLVAFICIILNAIRIHLERTVVNVFVAFVIGVAVYGMMDPIRLFVLDPNTGWRVTFWWNALEAMFESWGVGVGFGTEALRNEYTMIVGRAFFLPDEDTSFMLVGTHNAFFDTGLRLGIVGLILWTLVLARCYPSRNLPPRIRAAGAVAFFTVFICVFSNVALQSPLYVIGVAFVIGYLQSLRRMTNEAQQHVELPLSTGSAAALAQVSPAR